MKPTVQQEIARLVSDIQAGERELKGTKLLSARAAMQSTLGAQRHMLAQLREKQAQAS